MYAKSTRPSAKRDDQIARDENVPPKRADFFFFKCGRFFLISSTNRSNNAALYTPVSVLSSLRKSTKITRCASQQTSIIILIIIH